MVKPHTLLVITKRQPEIHFQAAFCCVIASICKTHRADFGRMLAFVRKAAPQYFQLDKQRPIRANVQAKAADTGSYRARLRWHDGCCKRAIAPNRHRKTARRALVRHCCADKFSPWQKRERLQWQIDDLK